ncbi:hypothetical protein D3C78_1297490 [compost metagenome]
MLIHRTLKGNIKQLRILMYFIHIKHMIRWCHNHAVAFCQHHCLKHIHDLSDICHLHPFAVFVENVQINASNQCIAKRILLIQESRITSRLYVIPAAPFIYDESDFIFRIIFIHNFRMLYNQFFHMQSIF